MSNENNHKAVRDIAYLRDTLEELVTLVGGAMSQGGTAQRDDDMGFMTYVFLSKQLDHATGILKLENHPDTQLIARSMLESRCQLLWAYQDPKPRALMWRAFVVIVDWRTLQAQDLRGEMVDATTRSNALRRVGEIGAQFRKARGGTADAYRREWHPLRSVRAIFEATNSMELYTDLYGPLSEWHHWSPGGAGRAVTHTDGEFVYDARSDTMRATALAAAFQCLHDTPAVADRWLNLGIAVQLADVCKRYITRLDPTARGSRAAENEETL